MLQQFGMENTLGALLRTAREAKGLTQAQVGAHVGITYSAVGQYESGSIRKPRPDRITAIASLLEIEPKTLNDRMIESYGFSTDGSPSRSNTDTALAIHMRKRAVSPSREVELIPNAPAFDELGDRRDVPELGISVGGEDGDFSLNGEVVGYVTRPRSLRGRNVFAVRVKGSSMFPAFREGDIVYVERNREPVVEDDGIFEMKPSDEWEAGHAFIKNLVSKGMGIVTVRQWKPSKEIQYRRDKIKQMYRVVPRNELLSL